MKPNKSLLFVALAILFWSLETSFLKLSVGTVDSFQALFYSLFFALAFLFLLMLFTGRFRAVGKYSFKDYMWFAFLGLLVPFLDYLLYYLSLTRTTASEALLMFYLFPTIIVLLAHFVLKEKLNVVKVLSVLIGLFGIYFVITQGSLEGFSFTGVSGNLFALLAGVAFGVYSVFSRTRKYEIIPTLFFMFLFGFIYSVPFVFLFSSFVIPTGSGLFSLIFLGIFPFCLAHLAWFAAFRYGKAGLLASSIYLTPVLSLWFIHLILGETIENYLIIGLVVILLGIILQKYGSKND